jgi:predicted AlkP superfamily pyrophosphatase or phosphodiesterase
LDYVLQREGPNGKNVPKELAAIDGVAAKLIDYFETRGAAVVVLSEYGIAPVSKPIHLNRILREAGLLQVRNELGRELLDAGASIAFAVADHQVAHVYVNDPQQLSRVRAIVESTPGVAKVTAGEHSRAGDLLVSAEPGAWFTYYFWHDDRLAPDYARSVDIHRKPGYDPADLFIDPAIPLPKLKIAGKLLKKTLGFRYLMDVIPLDATLVKGSHGIEPAGDDVAPLLITRQQELLPADRIEPTAVHDLILAHLQRR